MRQPPLRGEVAARETEAVTPPVREGCCTFRVRVTRERVGARGTQQPSPSTQRALTFRVRVTREGQVVTMSNARVSRRVSACKNLRANSKKKIPFPSVSLNRRPEWTLARRPSTPAGRGGGRRAPRHLLARRCAGPGMTDGRGGATASPHAQPPSRRLARAARMAVGSERDVEAGVGHGGSAGHSECLHTGEDTASRPCPLGSAAGAPARVWERGDDDRECSRRGAVSRARAADPPDIVPSLPSARLSAHGCRDGLCSATSEIVWGGQGSERRAAGERRGAKHSLRRHGPDMVAHRPHRRSSAPDVFSVMFTVLMILGGPRETEGWIALSKDGYVVTRALGLRQAPFAAGLASLARAALPTV